MAPADARDVAGLSGAALCSANKTAAPATPTALLIERAEVLRILNGVEREGRERQIGEQRLGRYELELRRPGDRSLVGDATAHSVELGSGDALDLRNSLIACEPGQGLELRARAIIDGNAEQRASMDSNCLAHGL